MKDSGCGFIQFEAMRKKKKERDASMDGITVKSLLSKTNGCGVLIALHVLCLHLVDLLI